MCDVIWKDVEGYEGLYKVSNTGRIYSILSDKYLKGRIGEGKQAYSSISLHKDGKIKRVQVHIIVAENFIPNPENKSIINHKDGVKTNNHVENLEWATYLENNIHALETGLRETKAVLELDLDGIILNRFKSCVEASISLGVHKSAVTTACKGKHSYASGHYLIYEKDYYEEYKPKKGYSTKKFAQYDLQDNLIATYDSIKEAVEGSGMTFSAIYRCCNGEIKNPKQFKWKYLEENK